MMEPLEVHEDAAPRDPGGLVLDALGLEKRLAPLYDHLAAEMALDDTEPVLNDERRHADAAIAADALAATKAALAAQCAAIDRDLGDQNEEMVAATRAHAERHVADARAYLAERAGLDAKCFVDFVLEEDLAAGPYRVALARLPHDLPGRTEAYDELRAYLCRSQNLSLKPPSLAQSGIVRARFL